MAPKKNQVSKGRMFMIVDGPGLLELQFSDYNPQGHIVDFQVEETDGAGVKGKIFRIIGARQTMLCQVTGSDRVRHFMLDELGRQIPGSARLVRVIHNGIFQFRGWFDYRGRTGLLVETGKWRESLHTGK